jgi:hypothetical protein
MSSTYGFTSWRWDEDQYLRPLTDRILSTSPSFIKDFTFVNNSRFFHLFNQILSSRSNDDKKKHFPILAWCRDEQLRLIDMDLTFRQTWQNYKRIDKRNQSDSLILSKSSRQQQYNRTNTNKLTMDVIEDETNDVGESDLDDSTFSEVSSPQIPGVESSETGDENDISIK